MMYTEFIGNVFSTQKIFAELRSRDIAAVGTVRSNANCFSEELALCRKDAPKLD